MNYLTETCRRRNLFFKVNTYVYLWLTYWFCLFLGNWDVVCLWWHGSHPRQLQWTPSQQTFHTGNKSKIRLDHLQGSSHATDKLRIESWSSAPWYTASKLSLFWTHLSTLTFRGCNVSACSRGGRPQPQWPLSLKQVSQWLSLLLVPIVNLGWDWGLQNQLPGLHPFYLSLLPHNMALHLSSVEGNINFLITQLIMSLKG